jgi:hypothetical protein
MNKRFLLALALSASNCQNVDKQVDTATQSENVSGCNGGDTADYAGVISDYLRGAASNRWTRADCKILSPVWTGDDSKGQLFIPLWRGVNAALEDWVAPPPSGNCEGLKGTVRVDWDKAHNTVAYTIKVINAPISPPVNRVDGGNPEIPGSFIPAPQASWWYNPFHRSPRNLPVKQSNGTAYRLWTIFATFNSNSSDFYYDNQNFLLKGSQFEFPSGPPPNSINVRFPISAFSATSLMYPDQNGFMVRQYTVAYDKLTSEGGRYSYAPIAFVPNNLCRALPYQPVKGQLRPYVSDWRPVSEGFAWDFVLRQGLIFDMTIEEGRPDVPPGGDDQDHDYIYTGAAFLNNTPSYPGGIPWGWHFQLPQAIQNVGPIITQVPRCGGFVSTPRVNAPLYCQGAQ